MTARHSSVADRWGELKLYLPAEPTDSTVANLKRELTRIDQLIAAAVAKVDEADRVVRAAVVELVDAATSTGPLEPLAARLTPGNRAEVVHRLEQLRQARHVAAHKLTSAERTDPAHLAWLAGCQQIEHEWRIAMNADTSEDRFARSSPSQPPLSAGTTRNVPARESGDVQGHGRITFRGQWSNPLDVEHARAEQSRVPGDPSPGGYGLGRELRYPSAAAAAPPPRSLLDGRATSSILMISSTRPRPLFEGLNRDNSAPDAVSLGGLSRRLVPVRCRSGCIGDERRRSGGNFLTGRVVPSMTVKESGTHWDGVERSALGVSQRVGSPWAIDTPTSPIAQMMPTSHSPRPMPSGCCSGDGRFAWDVPRRLRTG